MTAQMNRGGRSTSQTAIAIRLTTIVTAVSTPMTRAIMRLPASPSRCLPFPDRGRSSWSVEGRTLRRS